MNKNLILGKDCVRQFAVISALLLFAVSSQVMGATIINADTTWHAGQTITLSDEVQVAPGVTLTLEPGVSVNGNGNRIAVFGGTLRAQGTLAAPISITNAQIATGNDPNSESYIMFDQVTMSGGSFLMAGGNSGYGYFDLTNSRFSDVQGFYLVYPSRDSRIERNTFDGCHGLDVALGDVSLQIHNNLFINQTTDYAIQSYTQYTPNRLLVRYNSFLDSDKVALELPTRYSNAGMTATENYFGTTDRQLIDERVLDRLDSLDRASVIPIDPILVAPHPDTPTWDQFTVSGAVFGLAATAVELQNNAGEILWAIHGKFTFATVFTSGSAYAVTVFRQPNGWTCTVANGSGTIASANVTNVAVTCAANPPVATFTVGGTVSGLTGSVTLWNNGSDSFFTNTSGDFTFYPPLHSGSAYAVTISSQPAGQTCTVANGSGTIASANVTNVAVTCVTNPPVATFTVGGAVSGLTGGWVALQNNAGENLVTSTNGSFTFSTAYGNNSAYAVNAVSHPTGQTCTVANGSGTIASANVTNVAVTCATSPPATSTGSTMIIPLVAQTAFYTSEIMVHNPYDDMLPISVFYTGANGTSAAGGPKACALLSVPPLGTMKFSLTAQCNLPSGSQFGYVTLKESANIPSPFVAYSRAQAAGGNGFSVPAYPAGSIEIPELGHYVVGLNRQAAAPTYQSNCFVASRDAATDYQIRLRDATGNPIGIPITGSLQANQMVRYLDIFAAANAPPGDHSNVSATFANGISSAALIGFCTVQESTFFGADFRMAQPPKAWRYDPN